jgi:hypothetical protein
MNIGGSNFKNELAAASGSAIASGAVGAQRPGRQVLALHHGAFEVKRPRCGAVRVQLRAASLASVLGRLGAARKPRDRAAVDPQPARDLALRDAVRHHRPYLRPLHCASHLRLLARRR